MVTPEPGGRPPSTGFRWPGLERPAVPVREYGALPVRGGAGRPARVCLATPDVVGPVKNGGIGTAYTSLARALARGGHDVTILFAGGSWCEKDTVEDWIHRYAAEGIRFVPMPSPPAPREFVGPRIPHEAYRWLAGERFDVVHFPEWRGTGFFALEAKRLGLAFERTSLVVGTHSPSLWHDLENGRAVESDDQLALDFLERRSAERADVVVSPTRYLLRWMESWGWKLPERTFVQPNILPDLPTGFAGRPGGGAIRPRELVFFGRLERRKGIELFADAVDRLDRVGKLDGIGVTFLGKPGEVGGVDGATWARARGAAWRRPPQVVDGLDQPEALARLLATGALAVVPSFADNMPYTVHECVAAGIPVVATAVGGIPEMVAEEDRARVLVPVDVVALAERLGSALADGIAPPRPGRDPEEVRREWVAWHAETAAELDRLPPRSAAPSPRPLVSVCMATRNRPAMLEQALGSIRAQTHEPLEVVLVDDGSDEPEATAFLDRLEPEFHRRDWTLVRSDRRFPGAARNLAASKARGEWILFMDDDNLARPAEVETLLRAAEHSGVPIVTCGFDGFTGEAPPAAIGDFANRWIPLGGAMPLGLLTNVFGDTNALFRRDVFRELGGFAEERGAGLVEDWAFHLKAWTRGIDLAVVPEALFLYRLGPHGTGQTAPRHVSYQRGPRSLVEALPPELGLALLFGAGAFRRWEGDEARRLVDEHEQRRLASDFEAGRVVVAIGPSNVARLQSAQQVEIVPSDGGIRLRATGEDPAVRLPPFAPAEIGPLLLRIEATAPRPVLMQIFWSTPSDPADREERALLVPLAPGRNLRFARIPAGEQVARLRIDPSMRRDDVVLHSFEVRGRPGAAGTEASSPAPRTPGPGVSPNGGLARWLDERLPPPAPPSPGAASRLAPRWAEARQLLVVGPGEAHRLAPIHELAVEEGSGAIVLRASGHDPHLRLPPVSSTGPLLVRLSIEAPAPTRAELFWKSPWLPFWCGRQSVAIPLPKGGSESFVEVGGRGPLFGLRLDPGEAPGEYRLRSLEIRKG